MYKSRKTMTQALRETRAYRDPIDEGITGNIQKAIAIAKKLGGNMTAAVKQIEKIARGLSDEPSVRAALRTANEELTEAKWKIEGSLGYKNISSRDDFDMVIDAPTESAAEDKAHDELDKARDKRKIGPGGGGSVEDVEFMTVEKTSKGLSSPKTYRGGA